MSKPKYIWRKPEDCTDIPLGEICIAIYPRGIFRWPIFATKQDVEKNLFAPFPIIPNNFDVAAIQPLFVLNIPPIPQRDEAD